MKDELGGELALEFFALKAKMYSIKTASEEKKRAKGVSTSIIRKKLKHEDYKNCLFNHTTSYEKSFRIGQESHVLYTLQQNKITLSPFDDKRFLLDDGITSHAYGHYAIN